MSRTLPRRDREERVERSSRQSFLQERERELRERTSMTREAIVVRMASGRSKKEMGTGGDMRVMNLVFQSFMFLRSGIVHFVVEKMKWINGG